MNFLLSLNNTQKKSFGLVSVPTKLTSGVLNILHRKLLNKLLQQHLQQSKQYST
jgi:hypothetical protein